MHTIHQWKGISVIFDIHFLFTRYHARTLCTLTLVGREGKKGSSMEGVHRSLAGVAVLQPKVQDADDFSCPFHERDGGHHHRRRRVGHSPQQRRRWSSTLHAAERRLPGAARHQRTPRSASPLQWSSHGIQRSSFVAAHSILAVRAGGLPDAWRCHVRPTSGRSAVVAAKTPDASPVRPAEAVAIDDDAATRATRHRCAMEHLQQKLWDRGLATGICIRP